MRKVTAIVLMLAAMMLMACGGETETSDVDEAEAVQTVSAAIDAEEETPSSAAARAPAPEPTGAAEELPKETEEKGAEEEKAPELSPQEKIEKILNNPHVVVGDKIYFYRKVKGREFDGVSTEKSLIKRIDSDGTNEVVVWEADDHLENGLYELRDEKFIIRVPMHNFWLFDPETEEVVSLGDRGMADWFFKDHEFYYLTGLARSATLRRVDLNTYEKEIIMGDPDDKHFKVYGFRLVSDDLYYIVQKGGEEPYLLCRYIEDGEDEVLVEDNDESISFVRVIPEYPQREGDKLYYVYGDETYQYDPETEETVQLTEEEVLENPKFW